MEIQPSAVADGQLPHDEIVAAIIGVQTFLSTQEPAPPAEQSSASGWHDAAKLSFQGLRPVKRFTPPRWNTIERLRRSTGGFYGVIGL